MAVFFLSGQKTVAIMKMHLKPKSVESGKEFLAEDLKGLNAHQVFCSLLLDMF